MKKLYFLFTLALTFSVSAQNLAVNGDFESWVDANTPTGFSPSPFTAAVTQEATIKFAGMYSAKHQTAATSSVKIQKEITGIVPGHSYTMSYRFLDNDANARSRTWSYWTTDSSGSIATVTDAATDGDLRPATYSEDNAAWLEYSVTVTAPTGVNGFRFELRTYAQATGSGVVYYDNMSLVDNTTASTKNFDAIDGLAMYPNPVTGNVLNISSAANLDMNVVIFDVLGKQVINTKVTNNTVNVSSLNAGVYIVKITEDGKTATRKLVVR